MWRWRRTGLGNSIYIDKECTNTSPTTSSNTMRVIQSQYPMSASHIWDPRLSRPSHLYTAGADLPPPPQPLWLHLLHHAYTGDWANSQL